MLKPTSDRELCAIDFVFAENEEQNTYCDAKRKRLGACHCHSIEGLNVALQVAVSQLRRSSYITVTCAVAILGASAHAMAKNLAVLIRPRIQADVYFSIFDS